jgi:hypothetical protein
MQIQRTTAAGATGADAVTNRACAASPRRSETLTQAAAPAGRPGCRRRQDGDRVRARCPERMR